MKLVQIYLNTKYIEIIPYLVAHGAVPNIDFPPVYLPPDVDSILLGMAIKKALKYSKNISQTELFSLVTSGLLEKNAKHLEIQLIKDFSYINRKNLYKKLKNVSIELLDNDIKISSLHQNSLDGFSGIDDLPKTIISADAPDEVLGKAVKDAFDKCTSIY